jgi:hypothetical protein
LNLFRIHAIGKPFGHWPRRLAAPLPGNEWGLHQNKEKFVYIGLGTLVLIIVLVLLLT